jgi:hypothetical protein
MSNKSFTINGQTITVPEGMQVVLSGGAINIVPISQPKTVHLDKKGQKVNTAALAKTTKHAKKAKDKTPFLSKDEIAAIKAFFLAKGGCVSSADIEALAAQTGIPAGKIGYRINKHRQAVCYGYLTVSNNDAFVASLVAAGSWIAGMFSNPKIVAAREENLAKAAVPA